jgi:hypothetical protein
MNTAHGITYRRQVWKSLLLVVALLFGGLLSASPAWSHGNDETMEGYLLVQQALGHLAHTVGSEGIMPAMEKIDDALKAKDQEGVNIVELRQAKSLLEAGQIRQSQTLLQQSISQAISQFKPATGEQTGTTIVLNPLPGRSALTNTDRGFLIVSIFLLLLGLALAWLFRPPENIRELRQKLSAPLDAS